MLVKEFEDLANMVLVVLVILAVNQDVIDINNHQYIKQWSEDILYKGLKRGWGIGESKGHDLVLVVTIAGAECHLVNVFLVNPDLVVS